MTSAATITHASGTIVATALTEYRARRAANTVIHPIVNKSAPDYTFREFGLRTGSFTLVFEAAADADACLTALCSPQVLTLGVAERGALDMSFVIPSGSAPEISTGNAGQSTIALQFQEVEP